RPNSTRAFRRSTRVSADNTAAGFIAGWQSWPAFFGENHMPILKWSVRAASVLFIALVGVAVLSMCGSVQAQTLPSCGPASSVTPQPWNEARVKWDAVTTYTNGQTIVGTVTYTVYRRAGATGSFAAICTTTATATALPNQPNGVNNYTVTAKTSTSSESAQPSP